MGCGVSTEASRSFRFSFLQCCAFNSCLDESNESPLAGPNAASGQEQDVAQPVHRQSMSFAPARQSVGAVVPSSSRLSNEARPVSRRSGKWRKSLSLHRPSPLKDQMLAPPPTTPVLPQGRSVSPLPDFSHLRTSQILDLSSTPWLLVRSIAENVPAQDGRMEQLGILPGDLIQGHFVPLEASTVTSKGHPSLHAPVLIQEHHRALISPKSLTNGPETNENLVPTFGQGPQEEPQSRPRANTAPTTRSSKVKARRKKTLPSSRKDSDVENAVQELRNIVDEKRGDASSQSQPSNLVHSDSSHHVPAIAPSMKMPVRTEILSDIGSAFSKPLSEGNRASTVTPVLGMARIPSETSHVHTSSEAEIVLGHKRTRSTMSRISNLFSPSRSFLSSKTPTPPHHSGTFLLKTSAELLDAVSASPDILYGREIAEPHPSPIQTAPEPVALNKDRPASVPSSFSSSTVSTSRFPTAPTTPPRSRAASINSPPLSAHAVSVPPLFPLQYATTCNSGPANIFCSRPRTAPEAEISGKTFERTPQLQHSVPSDVSEQRCRVAGTGGLSRSEDAERIGRTEDDAELRRKASSKERKALLEHAGRSASLRRAREVRGLDSAAVGVAY